MREIKFRAWDKILNKYWYQFEICSISGYAVSLMILKPHWILEQYTGLKDKNGKEIFEGDIVEIKVNNNSRYQVKWVDELGQYFLSNIKGTMGTYFHSGAKDYTEVIGNIYENSDLLKEAISGK